MTDVAIATGKLAGVRLAVEAAINEDISRDRGQGAAVFRRTWPPESAGHWFKQAETQIDHLRKLLPDWFSDFHRLSSEPGIQMASPERGGEGPWHYSRAQMEALVRDIDQVLELRANSQPASQAKAAARRVFITHGRAREWHEVQAYLEKDMGLDTLELAQEPSRGLTIIEKLEAGADRCDSAVIVMTGDDHDDAGQPRTRENVMHEIGYFHAKFGRPCVVLLHEEGVSTPTNLAGIVYVPFPKGMISSSFAVMHRELRARYGA